jgi:hypothetical protein
MPILNTMFNDLSNTVFNHRTNKHAKMLCMNAQMERLYEAARKLKAKELRGEFGQSAVAALTTKSKKGQWFLLSTGQRAPI